MLAKEEREAAAAGRGCLGKAADDEPVFVLRAQDQLAAHLVAIWSDLAERGGCSLSKVNEARDLARAMRDWPTRKMPD